MKFKFLFILSAGFIFSVSLLSNISNAGLITNGSFESDLTGWTLEDADVFRNSGYGPGGLSAQDATWLLTLQHRNNAGRISQLVTTVVGQAYSLSFYHAFLDHPGGNSIPPSITWSIGDIGFEIISPASFLYDDHNTDPHTDGWNLQTVNFVATSILTRVAFQGTPDNASGYWGIQLDNVSMVTTEVPEPLTFAIFFLGLTGLRFNKRKM
ncbi:MAG: DUF642 domain-containing protein [Colwellia sp.]|nr:DUF642 domain-containing protein [Colwellia sp.]